MKNFDLHYFQRKITKSFWRFPIVVFFIASATISAIVDYYFKGDNDIWTHLNLTSILAIPLFISINLYLERVETSRWLKITINAIGFVILVLFFVSLPYKFIYDKHYIRSFVLFLAFVTSMFYLPFIGFHQQQPFWFYNYNFIKRITISFIYASVFFLGLYIALLIIMYLFKIDTSDLVFPIFVIFYILFFPWMVLAGLSLKFTYHANKIYYPTYLKYITKYVLTPIISLYAIILLIYIAKIILTGIWPSGWTVGIIIGYSLGLILMIVLIYPVLFDNENKILYKLIFSHLFISLLFFIIYFVAIFKRIGENGFTENRLFVIIYGIWYLIVAIYFIVTKINDLRVVPFSLLVIMFLSVSGPWNVFSISKTNQLNRLIDIAKAEKIYVNGKIQAKNAFIKQSSEIEINNIVHYLVTTHGHKSIKNLFPIDVDSLFNANSDINLNLEILIKSAGLRHNVFLEGSENPYKVFKSVSNERIFSVENARYFCLFELNSCQDSVENKVDFTEIDSLHFKISLNTEKGWIKIYINGIEDATLWLQPFYNYLIELQENNSYSTHIKQNKLKAIANGKFYDYTFYFKEIEYQLNNGNSPKPTMVNGIMIIGPVLKKNGSSYKSI